MSAGETMVEIQVRQTCFSFVFPPLHCFSRWQPEKLRVNPLENYEEWKIEIIEELSLCRRGSLEIEMEEEDIDAMLEAVTTDWWTKSEDLDLAVQFTWVVVWWPVA